MYLFPIQHHYNPYSPWNFSQLARPLLSVIWPASSRPSILRTRSSCAASVSCRSSTSFCSSTTFSNKPSGACFQEENQLWILQNKQQSIVPKWELNLFHSPNYIHQHPANFPFGKACVRSLFILPLNDLQLSPFSLKQPNLIQIEKNRNSVPCSCRSPSSYVQLFPWKRPTKDESYWNKRILLWIKPPS